MVDELEMYKYRYLGEAGEGRARSGLESLKRRQEEGVLF